jgi:type 1 glutamine amidotransferase
MKTKFAGFLAGLTALLLALVIGVSCEAQTNPPPKRLLLVNLVKGYGHASRITGTKVLQELAMKTGIFTIDLVDTDQDMATKMTAEALKQYDGVFFNSTTGDLPLPDKQAFLDWIKSGKAFIGVHAATDAFHAASGVDPYIEMIGGEFLTHTTARVDCINDDPSHPAMRHLGKTWQVTDEIYSMKNFSREKVHMLLSLDKQPGSNQPGFMPIAWCKKYGEGNVFYCALGHEDAVWQSAEYQQHLLGGIKWALGLEKGDAAPQTAAKTNN